MKTDAKITMRCWGPAMLFAWVASVFTPGADFAVSSYANADGGDLTSLFGTIWHYADDIGPFAKLAIGTLLAAGLYAVSMIGLSRAYLQLLANIAVCILAMGIALCVLPEAVSSGFGIGLTGVRFDPQTLPGYGAGALLAGVIFTLSLSGCRSKS